MRVRPEVVSVGGRRGPNERIAVPHFPIYD
jgi:hypothetical protein